MSLEPPRQSYFSSHRALSNVVPSGIGLETSILFASEGANVLLVDINLSAVEKAAASIKEKSPNVKVACTRADVGNEEDVKNAVDLAVKEFGRLDVMVRLSPRSPVSSLNKRFQVQ